MSSLTAVDFRNAWGDLSPWMLDRINGRSLDFKELDEVERDSAILGVLEALDRPLTISGSHRSKDWEDGWAENVRLFESGPLQRALIPGYFGKFPFVRWKQRWIRGVSQSLEYEMFATLLDWVADSYLDGFDEIHEFGCGTGHNLVRLRERFPTVRLHGLDWATSSQELVNKIAKEASDEALFSRRFDYFSPDRGHKIGDASSVLTVASLEQIGADVGPFLEYLLEQRPSRVVHVEPVAELLDPRSLLDALSLRYFAKRNYLSGLLDALRRLEAENKVVIEDARRTFVGSYFIDGYSLITWRPT